MKTIVATALLLLASLAADGALAQEDGPRAVVVRYADLDLSHAAGREVLGRRIALAVERVCPGQSPDVDLTQLHYSQICRAQALAGAQRQLAALHDGRGLAQAAIRVGPLGR